MTIYGVTLMMIWFALPGCRTAKCGCPQQMAFEGQPPEPPPMSAYFSGRNPDIPTHRVQKAQNHISRDLPDQIPGAGR